MKILSLSRRIPRLFLLFTVITLTVLFEGIGITSLIPVISFITNESDLNSLVFPFSILPDFFNSMNIEINLLNILFFVLLLMIVSFLSIYVQERLIQLIRYRILYDNRRDIGESIFKSNWSLGLNYSPGEISNKLIHETDKLAETLLSFVLLISAIFQFLIYIIIALFLSFQMTLVVLGILLISAILIFPLLQKSRKLGAEIVITNTSYSKQVVDAIKGFKLVKVSGLESYVLKKLNIVNKYNTEVSRKLLDYASSIKLLVQICLSIATIFIVYLSLEVFNIEISKLMVFVLLLIRMAPKYSTAQGAYRSFIVNLPALDIVDQMKYESDTEKENLNNDNTTYQKIEDKIFINNLKYKFNDRSNYVLDNVSFKIDLNSFVAIVGPSGAGKSTILDLIMGLLKPSEGNILIDNKDLCSLNLEMHRANIGFVPQENIFFNGTLRENLTFGKNLDDKFLYECLEIAQLQELVLTLPNRLETNIGENSIKLSGGQKQRLAIARALVRKPSILILDEATSSLDSKSEENFQIALENIAHKYTLIVVAHRLSTIKKANNIIVMNQGKIIEQGKYDQLASKNGLFTEMLKSQIIN
tara:strand:+ start:297 stop:2057 length:1761 start_codon:yes stop_codon:yes gene_type:complete